MPEANEPNRGLSNLTNYILSKRYFAMPIEVGFITKNFLIYRNIGPGFKQRTGIQSKCLSIFPPIEKMP